MSKRGFLTLSLLLLAACQTAGPKPQKNLTARDEIPVAQPQRLSPAEELRQRVQGALEQARQAVEAGDEELFLACEAAIVRDASEVILTQGEAHALAQALGEVWDELDMLEALLYAAEEEGEAAPPQVPEEVIPASPEKVAEAAREAEEVTFDLPVKVTPEVASLIDFYTGPYRERLIAALHRAARFLPTIREELARRSLPQDLAWLPLVESAFQPTARSRARATGLWQFMAGTARLYNLRCDGFVDERLDPFRATVAALDHLSDLYATFGDWELALAAYNSGAGRVERALRRSQGKTSFWEIRKLLPRETRNYVPAFWAALIVAKQPEKYGLPTFPEERPCREFVPVQGALDLEVLAERGGFDFATLRELNLALVRGLTPPSGVYPVAVPCGQGEQVMAVVAAIPQQERIKRLFHTVRRGETLASIARRYGVGVKTIMAANGITNPRTLRVGRELVIPKGPWQAQATPPKRHTTSKAASLRNPLRYRVRPGDTLYSIAKRHGLTVEAIRARNNLSGTVIRPGDVLYLAP